jgi:hypothetical protein
MNYSSSDDLVTELTNLPDIYAEVDEELNFTRIVSEIELGNSCDCPSGAQCFKTCDDSDTSNTATVDLRFSYPNNINIAAPTDYQDLSAILQTLEGNTAEEAQDTATPPTPANEQVPTNE